MTSITWKEEDNLNVKIIDDQHKHFVGLINALYKCLKSKDTEKLPDITKDVISYAKYHFKTEEGYFDKFNYEYADEHKEIHREMMKKAESFAHRKNTDPMTDGFDLVYFLERWLFVHTRGADKKFAKFLQERGIKIK